jgi:ABC-type sulfate transport system permease component
MTFPTAVAGIALVLLLSACGRVGPPVRSRPTPAITASASEQAGEDQESEKEKP